MGVTTTQTNKPFNPRGNDQSPKGFNRAKLYSGKALDFDGVNDYVSTPNLPMQSSNTWAIVSNIYIDSATGVGYFFDAREDSFDGYGIFMYNSGLTNYFDNNGSHLLTHRFPINQYFNIAVIRNGSDVSFYENGVFVETITSSATYSVTGDFYIGTRFSNSDYLKMKMGGFKAFDVALTAEQVADLYNNPEKVVPTGLESNLKLWLPMMEGAGTTAYNGAPDALGSELVTNGTFDTDSDWFKGTGWTISGGKANRSGASGNSPVYQNVPVVNGKRYVFSYTRTYVSGYGETNVFVKLDNVNYSTIGRYVSTITEEHKVIGEFTAGFTGNLLWQIYGISDFTGSIDDVSIKEVSGYGTINGATWTHGIGAPVAQTAVIDWNKHTLDGTNEILIPQGLTSGRDLLGNLFENVRKQGALNLDGKSWAEVHDNASLDLTTAVTLEAWVYWTGSNSSKGILGRWFSGVASYMLYASTSTQLLFFINTSNSPVNISGTGWKHIVGTYDSTNRRVYIDGQEIGSGTGYTSPIAVGDKPIEIGRYAGNTAYQYDGDIAQPRIYNRALTAEEVQRNYNAGKNTYTN